MVRQTAIFPVSLWYADAAMAAFSSCLTAMYRILSLFLTASSSPSDEVPGIPKTSSTPHFSSSLTMTSETVVWEASCTSSPGNGTKTDFADPQTGQSQSSGRSANGVPGGVPVAGSPFISSYTYPQTVHLHLLLSPVTGRAVLPSSLTISLTGMKADFGAPQTGQSQSSGRSLNAV